MEVIQPTALEGLFDRSPIRALFGGRSGGHVTARSTGRWAVDSGQALRPLPLGLHSRYPAFRRLVEQQATLIWAPSAPGKGRTRSQSRSENSCKGAPGGLSGPGPRLLASGQALILGCETGPVAGSELSGAGCLGFLLSPCLRPPLACSLTLK